MPFTEPHCPERATCTPCLLFPGPVRFYPAMLNRARDPRPCRAGALAPARPAAPFRHVSRPPRPGSRGADGGPDRGERLDPAAMPPAVDDAVALVVLIGDLPLAGHLLRGGGENHDS